MKQPGFFDLQDHMKRLSESGDPLETMARVVDFEAFRPTLDQALSYRSGGAKGGRPPYDPVSIFKSLILAAQNNLSDDRLEFMIRDRISWQRFLDFDMGRPMPDANTLRLFRERLTQAGAIRTLFDDFERQLRSAGYLPMSGQIVDATLVSAPRQRNTDEEKARIKAGESAADIWPDDAAKAAQKDVDARWTVKQGRTRTQGEGNVRHIPIAIPVFGYKSHAGADRRFGFIRTWEVTDAATYDGSRLEALIDPANTASDIWADTAYRSQNNEQMLKARGKVSRIHRKKPNGRPMSARTRRANARKSKVRVHIEHVFAQQKSRMGLFIRTIGLARAKAKIGLANIAYNIGRLIFHECGRGQARCA